MLDREKVLEWLNESICTTNSCIEQIAYSNVIKAITNGDFDVKDEK